MRKIPAHILATAVAFCFAAAANAQGTPVGEPHPVMDPTQARATQPVFDELDVNKDGSISQSEIPAEHELNTLFASYDTDQSESLNRSEFDAYASGDQEEEAE